MFKAAKGVAVYDTVFIHLKGCSNRTRGFGVHSAFGLDAEAPEGRNKIGLSFFKLLT